MSNPDLAAETAAVRAFNRFYTKTIGVLERGYLDSPFSLTEVRVLYELRHRERTTAAALMRELGLDAGYLSRLLARFEAKGLICRERSAEDGRQNLLALTQAGQAVIDPLEGRASDQIAELLAGLPAVDHGRLMSAMSCIRQVLEPATAKPWLLRSHRPGDLGWIVQRHGQIYAAEYGWDWTFEGLVAGIVADIARNFDAAADGCWIAEQEGRNIGSVALVRDTETVGRLRVLIVEPDARGLGVGRRLVAECIAFSRRVGYGRITLSTYSCLAAARRLYQEAGFQLSSEEPERAYGHDLVSETWDLDL